MTKTMTLSDSAQHSLSLALRRSESCAEGFISTKVKPDFATKKWSTPDDFNSCLKVSSGIIHLINVLPKSGGYLMLKISSLLNGTGDFIGRLKVSSVVIQDFQIGRRFLQPFVKESFLQSESQAQDKQDYETVFSEQQYCKPADLQSENKNLGAQIWQ